MPPSHYEVLNVSPQASMDEIHRSFRAMALSCHPDKNLGDAQATSRFQVIQRAWAVLGDSDLRSAYDVSLAAISEGRISEEVDLDDMHFEDDDDDAAAEAAPGAADAPPVERYSWPCRCGSAYIITSDMLEQGLDIVSCSGCSLCIRVLFEMADSDGESGDDDR